jgi:hypothetical protein
MVSDCARGGKTRRAPAGAVELLQALFEPEDVVLLRLIESWNDAEGKKCSRVAHKKTRHCRRNLLTDPSRQAGWRGLLEEAEQERAGVFFGVCPRFGPEGFDLAWQARTVRCLYSDVDGAGPAEVQGRLAACGLPPPSVLVGSGNGAHVYWLLDRPHLIDDAGEIS